MKVIDSKGKLFGKINIIDYLLLLVFVVAIAVVGVKVLGNKTVGDAQTITESINKTLDSEELPILKKTKSGEAVVDIKPLIRSAYAKVASDKIMISCILSADPSAFLNPEYIIKLLKDKCGILSSGKLLDETYAITRTNAYRENMSFFA